jgi:hypothetical protein
MILHSSVPESIVRISDEIAGHKKRWYSYTLFMKRERKTKESGE